MTRVEMRSCRASGLQAPSGRFADVGVIDSKMDGANFRMSTWDRAELFDSDLSESDFQVAKLPDSRILRCDLTRADLSKCELSGSWLLGSVMEGVQGAGGLHDIIIGSDQLIPIAIVLFAAMRITIDDDP